MMRAEANVGDGSARAGEFALHPVGELLKVLSAVVAPSNAGLVRDDNKEKASIVEDPGGLKDPRNPFEMLPVVYIGVINVDHAVAVEKSCARHQATVGYSLRSTFM